MSGRKPHQAAEVLPPAPVNQTALAAAAGALTTMSQEALALQRAFHMETADLTPATLIREIKLWIDHTSRAMFEVGMRLTLLRTLVAHGEWIPIVRDQIGMSPRTAQRMIAATLRCTGSEGRREKLLTLDRGKVLELLTLDDEHLDELERSGGISQMALDLDEIDSMSLTELRARLHDREATLAARDKLITKKDGRINELEEQLDRPFADLEEKATGEERALLTSIRNHVTAAESAIMALGVLLPRATDGSVGDACSLAMTQGAQYLAQRLAEVLNTAGVEVQFDELVTPAWLRGAKGGGARRAGKAGKS
jgi:hypothetical protein